jgi:hypothetical protein
MFISMGSEASKYSKKIQLSLTSALCSSTNIYTSIFFPVLKMEVDIFLCLKVITMFFRLSSFDELRPFQRRCSQGYEIEQVGNIREAGE